MESYKTLKSLGAARKVFKNSEFLGYASPVKSEGEARAFIAKIKALHRAATHNVSAYRVMDENSFALKYDDDGEPAGSSGKPVFRVLELKELNNVAVVVTRYFGGIKLGFGGLSRAYRETAVDALEAAGILEVFEMVSLQIRIHYPDIQKVKPLLENYGRISQEAYSDKVEFRVELKKELEKEFLEKLVALTKNKVSLAYSESKP